jgi:hypothetical protein
MNNKIEDEQVGTEAYQSMKKFLTHNKRSEFSLAEIWFFSFCMGYDFAKSNMYQYLVNKEELN